MVNRMCVYMLLFSCQVVSDSSQPDGMQQARFLCPPLSPRVCSNSCPLMQWSCLTILSSANPFSLFFQSFPASGSFPMSQSSHQVAKVLELQLQHHAFQMNIQCWFTLGLTGLISLKSKGLPRVFFRPHFESINSWVLSLIYGPSLTSVPDYWKNHSFD